MRKRIFSAILLPLAAFNAILLAQEIRPGGAAPPITAAPLDDSLPFAGWQAFQGNFVVIDFWATWCGPCLPGLARMSALQKEFAGKPIRFLTVANDESSRVKKYFADKGLTLQTYVEGDDRTTQTAYGIIGIPAAAIVDPKGRIVGVTPAENITADVLDELIDGKKIDLPPFQRPANITWDQDEITWQDGVQPTFEILIKPIEVTGGGSFHQPGSNRISGDGMLVINLIQAAWSTDSLHIDLRDPLPAGSYRFVIEVPKGQEAQLFSTMQDAIQKNFDIQARWEEQERDVLVMSTIGTKRLEASKGEPLSQFMRGKITLRRQSTDDLAEILPNWLGKIVVDETGLHGLYDFDLEYRDDGPSMLAEGLQDKYGLILAPAKRKVRILVVEKGKSREDSRYQKNP
jgi:uncharacterized protein (TIGR03435 family)